MKKPASNEVLTDEIKEAAKPVSKQVGTFVVINSTQIQGQRYNLEKVRSYGKSDTDIVSLVWDNGLSTNIKLGSIADADALIGRLDEYCL